MTDVFVGMSPLHDAPPHAALGREASPELNLMTLAPKPRPGETVEAFKFTGEAGEYFRIWIVNTFLTIVTIGLWSPWAKIRKRRFFLRHTWVAGANFEYHAQPWPILRGRLIAGAAFILYWFTGEINPSYAPWIALFIALLAPWLVVSSLRFNLGNTSHRNVRFAFAGTVADGMKALWPLVVVGALTVAYPPVLDPATFDRFDWKVILPTVALVALYPYLHGSFRLLLLNHSRFGRAPIACTTRIKTFYAIHFRGLFVGLGLAIAAGVLSAVLFGALFSAWMTELSASSKGLALLLGFVMSLPLAFATLLWYAFTQTRFINATFNLTTVSTNVRVFSQIRTLPMARLYMMNTLAIVFSLGLAIPWAAIRTARQRVETTALAIGGDIDDIIADAVSPASAAADAATEFFSFDVAL
jgi:uncharacterized membrane protein YjgN (DUF898 family)